MLSATYLINGTQLTTTPSGGSASTTTFASPLTLSGSGNSVTIENYSGQATINGATGNDTITDYAGSGGSITISDSGATLPDQLQVLAPTTRAANVTATSSQITLTTGDTVSFDSSVGSVSLNGQLFSNGDALTVTGSGSNTIAIGASTIALGGSAPTIFYSTFNGITVNGGASDNFALAGDSLPTTLNAGSGNVNFNVSTNSVALAINGGSGTDTYTVYSNSGQLTATGGTGNGNFTVYGSSSSMTLNGGGGTNAYTIQSNSASLNINGGGTANTVVINGNSSSVTARGGSSSTDSFTVNTTTGQVALVGGAGSSTTYVISAPTIAAVTVTGSTSANSSNALIFDGTSLNNAFSITTNAVSAGSGASVGFSHLTSLVVNGIGGNDSFLVNSDTVATTLNGAAGNDTFNIQSESGGLVVSTGSGASNVNLGSNAPLGTNNTIAGLSGAVTVNGDNSDTLNLNDAADSTARSVTLTSTGLTGLGFAGLTYSGLATLNVKLGSGGNTVAINSTTAGLITNFNTGAGTNAVYVSSTNTSSGVMSGIAGALNLTGGGSDALLLNDAGDVSSQTATLTPTTITGLNSAAITYNGSSSVTVNLGTGGNSFSITNTHVGTAVSVNGGAGADTLKIVADASAVTLTTGGGIDTVLVQSNNGATSVISSGNSTIDVGSTAPATGGVLLGISAGLTVNGATTDTLNVDDSGDASTSATGTLSATAIHGLGMGASGISYSGLSGLNLSLGSGGTTFNLSNTAVGTATNITGGASADTINLLNDASATTVTSGLGNDHINVQGITAATTIDTGSGNDVVYAGNNAPVSPSATSTIAATLTVAGRGNTTLDLDDTGDNISRTATLTGTTVTGINGGSSFVYSGLSALNVLLGTGGNTLQVNNTAAVTITSVNTGAGNDTVNVAATTGSININNGTGTNVVNVGSNAPSSASMTTNISGALNLIGNPLASDTLNLLDASDALPRVATLTASNMAGISPAVIGYTGFASLNVFLGSANSQLTVSNTMTGSTLIDTGLGNDTVTLQHDSGITQIRGANSTYYIQNAAAATTVNALGPDQITVGNPITGGRTLAGITATLTLNGNSNSTTLVDDSGDAATKTGTFSAGAITNLSTGTINYSNLTALNLNLGSGGNTLAIAGTSTPTTVTGGAGNDTLNVRADSATLTLAPAGGTNTVNIGSNAPASGGVLSGIASAVAITGAGTDTLNLDDSADTTTRNATTLTATTVTGLGAATVNYSGITTLRLTTGNAADTLNVTSTAAGTSSTVHTGTVGSIVNVQATTGTLAVVSGAADTVNVGSNAPASGLLSSITAGVTVTGLGHDTLTADDSSDLTNATGTLSATVLSGLGMTGSITYTGVTQLNLNLGSGNDAFTITGTSAATNVNGTGQNTIAVVGTNSATAINSPGTIIVGSGNISGGTVAGVTGLVTVTGDGTDQLILQDAADVTSRTGTLSSTQLILGPATVNYSGAATLAVNLGSGGDSFTINSTATATPVTINGGSGTDTLNIGADSSAVTIDAGSGTSVVNVATSSDVIDGLTALLTVTGTGTNTLNVNDTGSVVANTGSLSNTAITGLNTAGIDYSGFALLNLSLGSGGNTLAITNTAAATLTNVNSGTGADTINVASTGGTTNISTGAANNTVNVAGTGAITTILDGSGNDTINVGSNAPAGNSVTSNIDSLLTITANSAEDDTLNLLDASDAVARTAVLSPTSMTGISPAAIDFTGISALNLFMGTGSSSLNVTGTIALGTLINTSTGHDAITLTQANGPTQVQTGNSTVNVQRINSTTEIDSLAPNQITVGLPVTGGRNLSGINSSLFMDGVSGSTATVDDSADAGARTGTLTGVSLTGLSAGGINYAGLVSLDVLQGTAGDTFNITSTATGTPTTINGGGGNDVLNIKSDTAAVTYAPISGTNTINIGSNAPAGPSVLTGIADPVTITGTGHDTLNLDDSGDATVRSGETINSTSVTGFGAAAINYTGITALHVATGSAADTLTVISTAASTTTRVQSGTAGSTVDVDATTGPITVTSGAADTVNIGSNAPASSLLSTIAGNVTVTGLGTDTLNALDNSDSAIATGALSSTALTGLGAGGVITYAGVGHLNLHLGSGADTFTVNGTAANTAITGTGNNAIAVVGTTAPLAIFSPGAITVGNNVANVTGAVSVTGNGSDQLILNDTADGISRTGTLSATQLTLGPANVSYTGVATLLASLGNGGDAFTVRGTASTTPVTINGGTGIDTLNIGGDSSHTTVIAGSANTVLNVGAAGVLDGLTAPLTITGTGTNALNVNDVASTVAKTGSLTATDLIGLNTAGIHYTGLGQLDISLGSGGNTFDINSVSTPTTLTAGAGGDHLLLGGTDGTTNALSAPLTVNGAGTAHLTVDDTASTASKTLTLTASIITGLSPSPVTYNSLGALTIGLGSGSDTVNVQGAAVQTTIDGNVAGQQFNVKPLSLAAPITLTGSGTDPLVLDDSADASARSVTFATASISGLGGPISYTGMKTLTATLGSGADTATITGVDATVPTSIDGGLGANIVSINVTGDLPGQLTLTRFQTGTVNVGGNVTGTIDTDSSLSSVNVGGSLAGTLTVAGSVSSTAIAGNLSGTFNVSGGLPVVAVGGNLSGTLTTAGSVGSLGVTGNLSGNVTVTGNLANLHVKGGFTSSGLLNVVGALKLLELDGTDAGQTHVGSLQGVVEANVSPAVDGTIFSLTQGGVTRSIQELSANQAAGLAGTTFSVFYDDSTSTPQAAVRVNGGVTSQRFDLLLNAPAGSAFSLSRLDSAANAATEVRNVVIDGSLLGAVTSAEAAYFGYAANIAGGVQLPGDNIAAVSARDTMTPGAILAKSIQGIGYANVTGAAGEVHPGSRIAVSAFKEKLLLSTLALNAKTHKVSATIVAPNEALLVPTGTTANPTGLYAGHAGGLQLDTNGIIVWDHDATQSALASVTFSNARIAGEQVISQLAWTGTGGSVQTLRVIQNITSTGALGDVLLGAGKAETLSSLTAPSIEGTINLYGGKLKGTIQTTVGDIGAADGSTRINLAMASGSQIVSRGSLFSDVSVAGNLTGTIAAEDDISGGINVTGEGNSAGSVIAFGNVTGAVSMAGSFSGQMAAGGVSGITGNVSINKGLLKGGSVVSNGNIGDKSSGTVLATPFVRGLVVADGLVQLKLLHPANTSPVVESGQGSNDNTASVLAAVWNQSGQPIQIDDTSEDFAGLKTLKTRLKSLSISSTGSLT